MHTPQVQPKLVVDEDPHIVVALKREDLASSVSKRQVDLAREQIVVPVVVVLVEQQAVERDV